MTLSSSEAQFLLNWGGGENSEVMGGIGISWARHGGTRNRADEERREAPSWFCNLV